MKNKLNIDECDITLSLNESDISNEMYNNKITKVKPIDVKDFVERNFEVIFGAAAIDTVDISLNYCSHYLEYKTIDNNILIDVEVDFYPSIEEADYERLINRIKFYIYIELTKQISQIPFKLNISLFNTIDINRAFSRAIKKAKRINRHFTDEIERVIDFKSISYDLADSQFCLVKNVSIEFKETEYDSESFFNLIKNYISYSFKNTLENEIRNNYMNKKTRPTSYVLSPEFIMSFWFKSLRNNNLRNGSSMEVKNELQSKSTIWNCIKNSK